MRARPISLNLSEKQATALDYLALFPGYTPIDKGMEKSLHQLRARRRPIVGSLHWVDVLLPIVHEERDLILAGFKAGGARLWARWLRFGKVPV